ncbi:MAG: hypothetical protein MUF49_21535 [Oculatellaceae cyanobacterium Prado106]|jgi:Ca2+-binding RTX toxin-like protein|nr:hypothetical protein [Oculatellaceae cyanobacterium Prado106]
MATRRQFGTPSADDWTGTGANNIFEAGDGNDTCRGKGGSDLIDAGKGNDFVDGGAAGDSIEGGAGSDDLRGGSGDDTISGGAGNDKINGGKGDDTLDGDSGRDTISGGEGDDTLDGGSGADKVSGDAGDDNVSGGTGNDQLSGGDGDDFVSGNKGDDTMLGNAGNDTLDWDDGDGNDIMSGGDGTDTIEVDGSETLGDNFVLGKNTEGKARFDRVGVDGQPVGQFNLIVDTAEIFDVDGKAGNDTFIVNDLSNTGVLEVQFEGGEGNDRLDARNTSTHMVANGGAGDDILAGGTGTIPGPNNSVLGDTLTGGTGKDQFQFLVDPFAGGNPGQNVNRPDVITDYEQFGVDSLAFDKTKFGINEFKFQNADVTQLQDGNLLVLQGRFANAGQAAQAIAANANIKATKGIFVYYNDTLGFSRVVHSENLADGGRFSVQANLTNLNSAALQANFTAAEFALV